MSEYRDILCGKPQALVSKFRISYNWVLNLLSNNENHPIGRNIQHIRKMTEKSMIYEELQKNIEYQRDILQKIENDISQKKTNMELLKTPIEICLKYIEFDDKSKNAVNKKKKELQREMENIELEHRNIQKDIFVVKEWQKMEKEYEQREKPHLEYLETYMTCQIQKVIDVLIVEGFLDPDLDNTNSLILTPFGIFATKISEIHPLIWSKFISEKWNYLSEFSTKEIVGLLSCNTNINVSSDYEVSFPKTTNSFLKEKIMELQSEYKKYEDLETMNEMRTGISYSDALMFDIIDESMEWCDCVSEEECKLFIQTKLSEKEISVGDFTKAMMKISTIAKELSMSIENTELLFKLSQVDELILKYIATTQSLYV
jgi:hypothetical protein